MQYSLYLHLPFCAIHCTYCAFNIFTRAQKLIPHYVRALQNELTMVQPPSEPVHTIYLGGGTPSLLAPTQIDTLLKACQRAYTLSRNPEITMEINPGDVDQGYLESIREAGVNRLSIGMQSALPDELRLMARDHTPQAVSQVITAARKAGHTNISLDLIFGLPRQSFAAWRTTVREALSLQPDHLSMYALELEAGTALTRRVERGGLPQPDQDLCAEMYQWADSEAKQAGLIQYEISNWARPGWECRHNRQYWRYQPYLGFGAGAHGFAAGVRYEVMPDLRRYLELAGSQRERLPFPLSAAAVQSRQIDPLEAMGEYIFTGLRQVQEGVNLRDFEARFGIALAEAFPKALAKLLQSDLITLDQDRMRLTDQARLISNRVSLEFL